MLASKPSNHYCLLRGLSQLLVAVVISYILVLTIVANVHFVVATLIFGFIYLVQHSFPLTNECHGRSSKKNDRHCSDEETSQLDEAVLELSGEYFQCSILLRLFSCKSTWICLSLLDD
jgi:hypothetical protein